MPIPMIDREGRVVQVESPAEAQARFAAGELGFAPGSRVPIADRRSGELRDVDAGELERAMGAGFDLADPAAFTAESARVQRERRFSTPGQIARTAIEGFDRGATFGLSDAAARGTGDFSFPLTGPGAIVQLADTIGRIAEGGRPSTPEERAGELAARQEVNPGTAIAGEVAGTLPLALVPGAGEGAIARTSLSLGRLAARTAAREAVRGSIEGAAYGVGHVISEDALGRADLTGERLAAGGLSGFLLGGAGGGLFGGAGSAFSRATQPARELAATQGRRALQRFSSEMTPQAVERFAQRQAWRSLGGRKVFVERAARHGGVEGIGEVLLRRGVVNANDGLDVAAERLVQEVDDVGAEIGTIINQADTVPVSRPSVDRIRETVSTLANNLRGSRTGSGLALARRLEREAAPFLDHFAANPETLTVAELHRWRAAIDDVAYRGSSPMNPSPLAKELQTLRRGIEEEVGASIERAGGDLATAYRQAKRDYGALALARDAAADTIKRGDANRSFSLTDYLTTIGGSAAFSAIPVPGAGMVMGFLLGVGNKFLRENGPRLAAVGAHRLSRLDALRRVTQGVEQKTRGAIQRVLRAPRPRRLPGATTTAASSLAYGDTVREVQRWQTNPHESAQRLADATGGLAVDAPASNAAAALTIQRAMAYLHSRVPPASRPDTSILGHLREPREPSSSEQVRFMRAARVVADPSTVLEDLERGQLTGEAVDALRAVYPQMHADLVRTAIEELSTAEKLPPYELRVHLGTLLGVALDPSLEPEFIARMQALYVTDVAAEPAQPQPSAAPRQSPDLARHDASETQRLSARRTA